MRDDLIGRVLVVSLHQAIADLLPTRLGFYENWLTPEVLQGGELARAPFLAVLSFLRQEGDAYTHTTARAGEYAADWTVDAMAAPGRAAIAAMPRWLRLRLVMPVARRLVRAGYHGSRSRTSVRRGVAQLELSGSLFCDVREPGPRALCTFYAAAVARVLSRFDMTASAVVQSCRGCGDGACVVVGTLDGARDGREGAA